MAAWFLIGLLLLVYTFFCVVLIFVILIQSGKGGGLSSLGSASAGLSEALGATGAEKTLNKLTTWCAIGFVVLALGISVIAKHALQIGPLLGTPAATSQPVPNGPAGAPPINGAASSVPATGAPAAPAQGKAVAPGTKAATSKAPAPPAKK